MLDSGDIAFMTASSGLVVLMAIPGLAALYYGTAVSGSEHDTIVNVLLSAASASLAWMFIGYGIAFSHGGFIVGYPDSILLYGMVGPDSIELAPHIPEILFYMFHMGFASITPAIAIGAVADRVKIPFVVVYSFIWTLISYAPIAHMSWAHDGILSIVGVIDYAGGNVVHINAAVSAIVLAYIIGPRQNTPNTHNDVYTKDGFIFIGVGLLTVGWFGFNAGSALGANEYAATATINTYISAIFGMLTYGGVCHNINKNISIESLCNGIIAGLVCVTPMAGTVGPQFAMMAGVVGAISAYVVTYVISEWLGIDDTLNVFGLHGAPGIAGAILTGMSVSVLQTSVQFNGVEIIMVYSAIATTVSIFISSILTRSNSKNNF